MAGFEYRTEHPKAAANLPPRLGCDIGRVIIAGATDQGDPNMFDEASFMETPEEPGAFDALRTLGETIFTGNIDLVSKCGPLIQSRTLEWLHGRDFFNSTGISPDRVYFCTKRREKGVIAARLGLTHFVDDRVDVHRSLPPTVRKRILFVPNNDSPPRDTLRSEYEQEGIVIARDWANVLALLHTSTQ